MVVQEFSKNVADSALILGIMAGVVAVGKVIVKDLTSPNSAIVPYTTLLLFLTSAMTIKNCIKEHVQRIKEHRKNNLEEKEESLSDIEDEDGFSSSDDGGRSSSSCNNLCWRILPHKVFVRE